MSQTPVLSVGLAYKWTNTQYIVLNLNISGQIIAGVYGKGKGNTGHTFSGWCGHAFWVAKDKLCVVMDSTKHGWWYCADLVIELKDLWVRAFAVGSNAYCPQLLPSEHWASTLMIHPYNNPNRHPRWYPFLNEIHIIDFPDMMNLSEDPYHFNMV